MWLCLLSLRLWSWQGLPGSASAAVKGTWFVFLFSWGISSNCTQLPYFSPGLSTKPLNSLQTKLPPVVSVYICSPFFFGGGKGEQKKEEYLSVAVCILLYFEKQKASAGISFKLRVYLCQNAECVLQIFMILSHWVLQLLHANKKYKSHPEGHWDKRCRWSCSHPVFDRKSRHDCMFYSPLYPTSYLVFPSEPLRNY